MVHIRLSFVYLHKPCASLWSVSSFYDKSFSVLASFGFVFVLKRERERIYYIIARVSESPLLDGATERVLMIVPFNRTMTTTTTSMAIAQKEGGGGDGSVLM